MSESNSSELENVIIPNENEMDDGDEDNRLMSMVKSQDGKQREKELKKKKKEFYLM